METMRKGQVPQSLPQAGPVRLQVNAAAARKAHPLALEAQALGEGSGGVEGAEGQAAAGPDDAMPGKGGEVGLAQNAADEARPAGEARGGGDVAVGRDLPARDAAHRPEDGEGARAHTSKWTPWARGSSRP